MYAITATSYRGINSPDDVLPGETFAEQVPQEVLDAIAGAEVRFVRNALLRDCDWTQNADSPLSVADKAAWATYREALRNLPLQLTFPHVQWPTTPGANLPLR